MDRPPPAHSGNIPVHLFFALLPPQDICPAIDRLGITLQRAPLVLRGDQGLRALVGFRHEIRARMTRAGFAVTPGFTPHLTLLWADDCVEAHPLAPIGWTARDFALVLSLVGQSRHIHLARWPLQ